MSQPRTFRRRFYLDQPFNRSSEGSNQFIGTTLKAFRVLGTNNNAFELDIVADPNSGSIEGIPLGKVRLHNYARIANSAVVENKTVQAGVYVDILFSVEDELVYTGAEDASGATVVVSEGSNHNSIRVDVLNNTTTQVIPSDDTRALGVLQLKAGGTFWYGNPTASELNHADYKNICQQVTLSPLDTFQWKNSGAMNVRTDAGPLVFSLLSEKK